MPPRTTLCARAVSAASSIVFGAGNHAQKIPAVIRSGQEVEVWAGAFTASTFEDKEKELNAMYNPPWVERHG
jgi:hypothetical protein